MAHAVSVWKRMLVVVAILAVAAVSRTTQADTQAIDLLGINSTATATGATAGWDFTVSRTILVTQLGLWDYLEDGLVSSHKVTIWDADGKVLTYDTVSSNGYARSWHWKQLDPASQVVLTPGQTYTIGSYNHAFDRVVSNASTVTEAAGVDWLVGRWVTGDSRPTTEFASPGLFGPNFQYQDADVVPEAGTLVGLGAMLGLVVPAWWRRRRPSRDCPDQRRRLFF